MAFFQKRGCDSKPQKRHTVMPPEVFPVFWDVLGMILGSSHNRSVPKEGHHNKFMQMLMNTFLNRHSWCLNQTKVGI